MTTDNQTTEERLTDIRVDGNIRSLYYSSSVRNGVQLISDNKIEYLVLHE